MVSFRASKDDAALAQAIAERASRMLPPHAQQMGRRGEPSRFQSIWMDIIATHVNGNPLKLRELRDADDFNFLHDVTGIIRHLDRSTGKLMNCFVPRFSQPETK